MRPPFRGFQQHNHCCIEVADFCLVGMHFSFGLLSLDIHKITIFVFVSNEWVQEYTWCCVLAEIHVTCTWVHILHTKVKFGPHCKSNSDDTWHDPQFSYDRNSKYFEMHNKLEKSILNVLAHQFYNSTWPYIAMGASLR